MIAIDTETHLANDGNDGRPAGECAPRLVCVSFSSGALLHRMDQWQSEVTTSLSVGAVGHHFAYDAAVMMVADPGMVPVILDAYAADRVTDTMVRQKLSDIAHGRFREGGKWWVRGVHPGCRVVRMLGVEYSDVSYSLAATAKRTLGVDLQKEDTWRLRFSELTDTPVQYWPPAAREYAITDASTTLAIHRAQPNWPDEYRQARAALWIHLMRCWGFLTDPLAVRRLEEQVRADLDTLGKRLVNRGLLRFEKGKLTRCMKAAQELIAGAYTARGLPFPMTPAKQPALHREACENSGNADLVAYAEYSALTTELSKDIKALKAPILHSWFESLVDTGRPASSGPNVFNLPRRPGVRECFIPRPGHVFVCADAKGLELVTLAQVCFHLLGRSSLGDALNRGQDAHLMIAEDILQIPYPQLEAIKNAGPQADHTGRGCHCWYCLVDNARQCGKVSNFGLPGGLGWETLIHYAKQNYQVDLTPEQSKALKATWFRRWSEMPDYLALINNVIRSRGGLEQVFSHRFRGDIGFTEGCNTLFQGLGADLMKDAGWVLACEEYDIRRNSPLFGCRTVNFPYDEFVVETLEDRIKPVAARLRGIIREAGQRWCPDVKLDADVSAMRRYSKKAVGENKVVIPT